MSGSSSSVSVLIFLMPHHAVTHLETTSSHSVIRPALGDCVRGGLGSRLLRDAGAPKLLRRGSRLRPSLRRDETGVRLKEERRVNKGNRRWREGDEGGNKERREECFQVNVSGCAKKACQRSPARDCVRFLRLACTHFLNIQIRH